MLHWKSSSGEWVRTDGRRRMRPSRRLLHRIAVLGPFPKEQEPRTLAGQKENILAQSGRQRARPQQASIDRGVPRSDHHAHRGRWRGLPLLDPGGTVPRRRRTRASRPDRPRSERDPNPDRGRQTARRGDAFQVHTRRSCRARHEPGEESSKAAAQNETVRRHPPTVPSPREEGRLPVLG